MATMRSGSKHAGGMVDGAGHAEANVEIRGNGFAGLPDLGGAVDPPLIAGHAGGAHCATQELGEFVHRAEVSVGAAAADDDNLGFGEVRARVFALGAGDKAGALGALGER